MGFTGNLLPIMIILVGTGIGSSIAFSKILAYIIFKVSLGVSSIYLLFTLTALAVLASLYMLVVKPIGERKAKENGETEFFKYFSIFILLEFFISIISGFIPGYSIPSIYSMPLGVQAFVLGVSSLADLAILQFVPLFIMILAYFALTGKLSKRVTITLE